MSSVRKAQYPELRARTLLDAEAEAARVIREAHAEADAIRRAAESEYDTWRAQAVREAEEQVERELTEARLAALALETRALAQLRAATVPLVMRATEKLVRESFESHPELVRGVIADAVRQLRLASELLVEVHPDDLALAEGLAHGERPLLLRANPSLARGECRVSSDVGAVDGRFAAQLGALEAALRGAASRGAPSE